MPRVDTDSFYRHAMQVHGDTARGVHWSSTRTQETRFRILRELLPNEIAKLSIVDAGCGFGHLHRWLAARGDLPRRYIGLEIVAPMAEAARECTGCKILQCDVLADPLPDADWYLCSGAMNTLTREEARQFVERCYLAALRGFVFNLLRGPDRSGTFNYFQPEEVHRWAGELDARLEIREGYLPGDFSVGLFRPAGPEF